MSCEKVTVSQSQLQPLLLKDYLIAIDVNNCPQQGRGGGVLWISSDGDDRRIYLGLKFSIPRFFLGGGGRKI